MSVSKYIEEFNISVQESIQKNITRAEENPYPSEEIKQIRESEPESALAKMFDENEQLINPVGNQALRFAAIDQDKDLYERLRKGHRAKERLKNNERLEALNAEEYLNNIYFKFKQEQDKIDVEQLLDPANIDDFEEVTTIGFGVDTSYVDIETIQSAFLEKNSSQAEETTEEPEGEETTEEPEGEESQAINNEEILEQIREEESEELITPKEPAETGETIETDVKTIQEALSIPEEAEQLDEPEVSKEIATTSPINQDAEAKETPEESLDQTELGEAPVSKEAVTIPDSETSQSPISQPEPTPIEQVDSQPQSIPKVESPAAAEQAVSPIGNEKPKKIPFFQKIKNALSQEGGVISNISNVLNSAGDFLQDGSISNLISNVTSGSNVENNTINQSGDIIGNIKDQVKSKQDKVLGKESSVSNLSETFLNQDFSKAGDVVKNTNLGGAVSNIIDKSSSFSPFPKSEIIKPEPITKADINEVGESISTNVSSSITPSLSIQESDNNPIEISGKEKREARAEIRQEKRDEKKAARGITSVNNDFSSMEKRLKNIELLLMGPLEVKIKN